MPWSRYGEVFGSSSVPEKKEIFHTKDQMRKKFQAVHIIYYFIDQYVVTIREKLSTIIEKMKI